MAEWMQFSRLGYMASIFNVEAGRSFYGHGRAASEGESGGPREKEGDHRPNQGEDGGRVLLLFRR